MKQRTEGKLTYYLLGVNSMGLYLLGYKGLNLKLQIQLLALELITDLLQHIFMLTVIKLGIISNDLPFLITCLARQKNPSSLQEKVLYIKKAYSHQKQSINSINYKKQYEQDKNLDDHSKMNPRANR